MTALKMAAARCSAVWASVTTVRSATSATSISTVTLVVAAPCTSACSGGTLCTLPDLKVRTWPELATRLPSLPLPWTELSPLAPEVESVLEAAASTPSGVSRWDGTPSLLSTTRKVGSTERDTVAPWGARKFGAAMAPTISPLARSERVEVLQVMSCQFHGTDATTLALPATVQRRHAKRTVQD